MAIIRCRRCGADDEFEPGVTGKLCESCGADIYTPEFKQDMRNKAPTPVAMADRTGDVFRVTCPRGGFVSKFPEFDMVDIFICDGCGEPVVVNEPIQ